MSNPQTIAALQLTIGTSILVTLLNMVVGTACA
jgi:ABC-type sulfate transport system permease component